MSKGLLAVSAESSCRREPEAEFLVDTYGSKPVFILSLLILLNWFFGKKTSPLSSIKLGI